MNFRNTGSVYGNDSFELPFPNYDATVNYALGVPRPGERESLLSQLSLQFAERAINALAQFASRIG